MMRHNTEFHLMSPLALTLSVTLVAVVTALTIVWVISLLKRDAGIIDPCWGAGFGIVVWTAWAFNRPVSERSCLLLVLTTLWALRLSLFLLWRNLGHPEDYRYAQMRARHGVRFWWVSLLTVFLLQAVILWFVSLPLQFAIVRNHDTPFSSIDLVGVLIWATGLFFEAAGDWQLMQFRRRPENAGLVMDRGLWRYTRHPNYFGDFCVWWGLYLIAAGGGAAWTIGSPLLMSYLLLRVSGVRLLESTIGDRRPDYARYKACTSAFFPAPRRQLDSAESDG